MDSSNKTDTAPPTSQPQQATPKNTPTTVPSSTQNPQNPPLPAVQPTVTMPHPPKEPPTSEATKPSPTKLSTPTAAAAPNPSNKPHNQEQDGKVTTSVTTTVSSSMAPTSQSGPKVPVTQNQPSLAQSQAAVPTNSSTNPASHQTPTPTSQPPTTAAESRSSSTPTNAVTGIKRPPPEADPGASTQQTTDSDNVSKRKKVRKDKEPGKSTADSKETGSSGQEAGEPKSDTSANTGINSSPKVPPIKIVLQSHGPNSGGSGNSGTGAESDSANSSSHAHHHPANGSGFPYVVSSTTPDTTTTTTSLASVPAPSRVEGSTVTQDKKDSGTTALTSNELTKQTPMSQINSATTQSKITSSVLPPASTTSGPASSSAHSVSAQNSQASAETLLSTETRKDPVVKLDVMSSIPAAINASAAKEASKETSPPVTTAPSSTPVPSTTVSVPVTSAASATAEESGPVPTSSTVTTTNETTTTPTAKTSKDKPQRVTRSSHRIATNTGGVTSHIFPLGTPNSPGGGSPKPSNNNSACPSPNHMEPMDVGSSQSKVDSVVGEAAVELGSRKRKVKGKDKDKEPSAPSSSSSSTSGDPTEAAQGVPAVNPNDPPLQNCVEMFLNIRKQIERRRRNLFPVQPKPPQGFKDYLMNRGTYVLASNSNAQHAVSTHAPPISLPPQCKEMFIEQEKERHKLRMQQVVEKEKLVLSVEQEILRVHGRAARALSNQALPFSVCTILKDLEVYNLLTPEQEEKDRNARSRYNGRLFLSWLQDVDDKWDKIKEAMLLRHHNEAESLHAVQKMDWEWKLKEVGLCEPKGNPQIDEIHVPMVNVSDDFDLLPA